MPGKIKYTTTLTDNGHGGICVIINPEILNQLDPGKKRIKVKASFDGIPYRGLITPYGGIAYLLVLKKIQQKLNKKPGDKITITLQKDSEERIVDIPADLKKSFFKNKKAFEAFTKLSYTNRKEYVVWIETAKKQETRNARLADTIRKLLSGKMNPSQK